MTNEKIHGTLRVVSDRLDIDDDGTKDNELRIKATDEGLIFDLLDRDGNIIGSASRMYDEIVEQLIVK